MVYELSCLILFFVGALSRSDLHYYHYMHNWHVTFEARQFRGSSAKTVSAAAAWTGFTISFALHLWARYHIPIHQRIIAVNFHFGPSIISLRVRYDNHATHAKSRPPPRAPRLTSRIVSPGAIIQGAAPRQILNRNRKARAYDSAERPFRFIIYFGDLLTTLLARMLARHDSNQ